MASHLFKLKTVLLLPLLLGISACAHKVPPPKQTMTLCDDNGCAERPKNYQSFVPENATSPEQAAKIASLEQLANKDPRAAYDLALRFFRGDGVWQDSYQSIKWMRDAAEKGFLPAQKALGRLYLTGLGEMGADFGEAQKWLAITAGRGDKEAESLLNEATAARETELADYKFRRWRPIFNNYWSSGYQYHWYWNNNQWLSYY